ncbi:MAG: NAD-dependent epimerase/dehydratase family protein [Promethearchaeota archaeon]
MVNNKKLLFVDGAKGHTGIFLIKALLEKYEKCEIIATDLPPNERESIMTKEKVFRNDNKEIYEVLKDQRVKFIPANLTNKSSLNPLFQEKQYDVIFHTASLYDYFADLKLLRKINVQGTRNLLEVICKTQDLNIVRFIHWSTCGVYGEPDYKYDPKTKYVIPANENASYDPPNDYSISKMEQELVVKEFYNKKGLKMTILRPAPIYGPYQSYGTFHILHLAKIMGNGFVILLFPKKHRLMFPSIHVLDLVLAAIYVSEKDEAIGEAYNILHDPIWMDEWLEWLNECLSVRYNILPIWFPLFKLLAKALASIAKLKNKKARKLGIRPIVDLPMVKYLTHQYAFSNQKIKNLGYEFKFDTINGFKETIDWYFEHGWLPSVTNKIEVY